MKISHYFIDRPILSSVLSIALVLAGLVAMLNLPIAQFPDIAPPTITVSATYPGANSAIVAQNVAAPIEQQVNGADNMMYMSSSSSSTGAMTLTAYFEPGTNPALAQVDVQNRVNLALPTLPQAVTDQGISVQKRSAAFLMIIAIYSPRKTFDQAYVANYANVYVLDRLKRISGANQASVFGSADYAMRIWLRPDLMAKLAVTASDVQHAIAGQNQQFSAGRLGEAPTRNPVLQTFPLATQGQMTEPAEFENIILRAASGNGAIVRLKDVANVELGAKDYSLRGRYNGATATLIAVYQQPGANALQVAGQVRQAMEELRKEFPPGIEYSIALDTTDFVRASISEVVKTLIIAIFLVVGVVYVFLQSLRATIVPILAVPVSIIGAFVGMIAFGFSINMLTLFGMVLAIGIVVDDAIVVIENVERNMEAGDLSPKDAAKKAMDEVSGPVVAIVLVMLAVFVPVAFLSGITGALYKQFAVTIAVSVVLSGMVALTLSPALAAILLRPARKRKPRIFARFNSVFQRLTGDYGRLAATAIRRLTVSLLLIGGVLALTAGMFQTIPSSFVPVEDQGYLLAAVILPDAASLDRTSALSRRAEQWFAGQPGVQSVAAPIGYSLIDSQYKANAGTLFVTLKPFGHRGGSVLRRFSSVLVLCVLAGTAFAAPSTVRQPDERPWPRQYTANGTQFSLYRPELDSWSGNQLQARAVMAVKTGTATDSSGKAVDQNSYGVVWLKARTDTDKQGRMVTLNDVSVTKANFPAAADREAQYRGLLQGVVQGKTMAVSLDQLEAALSAADTRQAARQVQVNNSPPDILFFFKPAVLIPIDGEPAWRPSGVAGVDRVVNTKAMLLRYQGRYYLGYAGHWASSDALDKGWAAAATVPAPLQQVMQTAETANRVPSREALPPGFADTFQNGGFPAVYIRSRPAELITVNGDPQFDAIPGTSLSYVSNTAADVFVDGSADHNWFVLVSGRWFSGPSSNGPWRYVAANSLPADFAKIPVDTPKGAVLASVAGTPQAREAVIANAVPQTATVDKSKVSFQARYDGAPQFKPLAGTSNLTYAVNSATPIIDVPGHSYYALDKGVWFVSETSPQGPWTVATSVPAEIYALPASSPLHYVTYARLYGSSGNNVYVGYTPGYYGTVVSNGTVVYGTGYPCDSWIGTDWYGCPATYGYGAALAYGAAVGWDMAFGWGWDYPWYNPWWGPWAGYYPGYYPWAYGGAAAWNVYGRWGNSVVAGTRAAWANPWTGNYGRGGAGGFYNPYTGSRGYGYAARNVNAYTGRSTAAAGGIRYNPQTGRVVAGRGGAAGNIYSGDGIAGGARTAVNTNTGRVTNSIGGLARGPGGATAAGAFNTTGAGGDAKGGGYVHYNRATGDINRGGAIDVNGNMYAGRDGNVYRNTGDGWEKMGGDNRFARSQPAAGLDSERFARSRGFEREGAVNNFGRAGGFGAGGGHFASGGFGGGRFSGGFRGGGMHGFRR